VARKWLLFLCSVFFLWGIAGCTSPRLEHAARDTPVGRSYQPDNVYAVESLPPGFDRVLVLPLKDPSGDPLSSELTDSVLASLRRIGRFDVIPSGPVGSGLSDSRVDASILANQPIPVEILSEASRLGVDGILQLRLTHYRPFKPLQIGLRGRLIDLGQSQSGGQVLWEIDELFDAGQQSVAIGARKYSEAYIEQAFPLQSSYSSLMSPVRFAGYVSLVAFETLPPRRDP